MSVPAVRGQGIAVWRSCAFVASAFLTGVFLLLLHVPLPFTSLPCSIQHGIARANCKIVSSESCSVVINDQAARSEITPPSRTS